MQAEINRLYVAAKDGTIVPVSVTVPRRQLIDFHSELFPPVPSPGPLEHLEEPMRDVACAPSRYVL